jgi:hypothetical protein
VPLVTAAGVPAVVGKRLGEGQLVCVGIPLDLASDSPVFHPLFPHLIAGVTCVAEIAGGEQGHVVGESPTVGDLFGVKEFAGDVLVPGGDPRPVSRPDTRLFLDRPGTWRLAGGGGSVAVNMPRPLALPTPSRDEWLARHGSFDVTWADDNTDLGDLALYVRTGRRERTYDASSVAALLLLLGLLGEASLRVLGARRRGAVDA